MQNPELIGYRIGPDTLVVFIGRPPPRSIFVIPLLLCVTLVAFWGLEVLPFAALIAAGFTIAGLFPRLVALAVEVDAFILVRAGTSRRGLVTRVPFCEVLRLERGHEFLSTDLTIVQTGRLYHDISFVTKGKFPCSRFHRLVNKTNCLFPDDPVEFPEQSVDALCNLLSSLGLVVNSERATACDRLVYGNFLASIRRRRRRHW